ncbi:uncharacterized protein LOC126967421 isoform X2 [Leptidea sinapis]|uniref:uncharacterized protein LOC126967421 isoform X2 n=1 Tax=Leptidea sinapis TaxID=189913 RepID=UPI0021C2B3E3|nr:uncharacterized protein LOC126967421 isoform X2 [Leptidea sinapis]
MRCCEVLFECYHFCKMFPLRMLWVLMMLQVGRTLAEISEESDDMERESIVRRDTNKREWQYEGIPIEFSVAETEDKIVNSTESPDVVVDEQADRRYRRIYNADEAAAIEEYPFLAALLVNRQLWCGAALIAADRALTAAHCLQLQYNNRFFREYVKMLSVRVGSSNATAGGELYRVSEIFFHPNYKPNTLEFNFAVIRLHKNISYESASYKVSMIEYSRDTNVPTDSVITFLGWGSVLGVGGVGGQVLLQKLELPIYDLADCQEVYGRDLVTRTNFCAGYITKVKNVCNHDAGGPAIMNGMLIGTLSFSSKRCDLPDQPAVFSRVGAVAAWLDHIADQPITFRTGKLKKPEWINRPQ